MTLALLALRAPEATICPSEVARAVARANGDETAEGWRGTMPAVHAAIDGLVAEAAVRLSWKGERLTERVGPYRVGRGEP